MSTGKLIILLAALAAILFFAGDAIWHSVREYHSPTFSGTKAQIAKDFEADISNEASDGVRYDKNGQRIVYQSDEEYRRALKTAYNRINRNEEFLKNLETGAPESGQSNPQTEDSSWLAKLPTTPSAPDCRPDGDHVKCVWPTQADHWVSLGVVPAGVRISADPAGAVGDTLWPQRGIMGALGTGTPCNPANPVCKTLPAPKIPPYATIIRLGDGPPLPLPVTTTVSCELFVRLNYWPPHPTNLTGVDPTGAYVAAMRGSQPLLVRPAAENY